MEVLNGVRVIELAGPAPSAFAATLLADLGADVVRIDRPSARGRDDDARAPDPLSRGRRLVAADLKHPDGVSAVLSLTDHADVMVEGFRPGVCERLGLGPGTCLERNPGLVFGRVSGWGQDTAWSQQPGHDITFLALAGALEADRDPGGPPSPPSTYLSSFGGGGMMLALGVLAALFERGCSGRGQVVDAAMLDGAALLGALIRQWRDSVGGTVTNAPFYTTYVCQDGRHVAVGAIEPPLYQALVEQLGLAAERLPDRTDEHSWPELEDRFAAVFRTKDSADWAELFMPFGACVVPVLTAQEAALHPAARERGTYVKTGSMFQPVAAPRFSRTQGSSQRSSSPRPAPAVAASVLRDWSGTRTRG